MQRYLPFAIICAVLLVAAGSAFLLFHWKQPPAAATAPIVPIVPTAPADPAAQAQEAPAKPDAESPHIRGGANASVTLEEYGDFQCLPCAELFPKLAKVEEDYGNRLRVVFHHKPLQKHVHAVLAARAAEAAGLQGRFWEMHDLLFQNSLRWTKGVETVGPNAPPSRRLQSKVLASEGEVRDVLIVYAEMLKLDIERFKQDIDSDKVKARVESERALGDLLGIDRTPTVYLNGRLLPHLSLGTVDALHAAIDAEINGKQQEAAAATPEQPR